MGMRFSKSNSMSLSTNRIDDYRRELSGACESGVTVKKRGGGGSRTVGAGVSRFIQP